MPTPVLPPELAAPRRRARRVYALTVGALVVALAVVVGVVIGTGEAAHASLQTSAAAPAVPGGTVRAEPTVVWRSDDHPAGGDPLSVGNVVTWSGHRLAGRDATTGDLRWSYTRTDAEICDAYQRGGTAYVLFRRGGNCDELSTFAAGTGVRGWYRTLPDDGTGRFSVGTVGLVIAYPTSFHAIDATSGIDRYPSVPVTGSGCRFTAVTPGDAGVLVSESCGDGDHLALWSNSGSGDPSAARQLWRVGVGAGTLATAVTGTTAYAYLAATGTLGAWSAGDGRDLGTLALDPAAVGTAGPAVVAGEQVLVTLGDRLYAVAGVGQTWTTRAAGDPSLVTGEGVIGDLADDVLLPTSTGTATLDLATGTPTATTATDLADAVGTDTSRVRVYPAGAGLLAAGDGVAYLR